MKYLKVWTDLRQHLKPFSEAEKGRLFDAMMEYAECGTVPDLRGNERFIWETVKAEIDRQRDAYEKKCEVNRINGASRTQSHPVAANGSEPLQEHKTEEHKTKEKEKEKRKIFTPPTAGEVAAYCAERNNGLDADAFVNFYASKGWMIGKNRMKDWRAAVRTWEQKHKQDHAEQQDAAQVDKNKWAAWIRGEVE